MVKVKKIIKKLLPDRVIYYYNVIRVIPEYLNVSKKSRNMIYPEMNFYSDNVTVDKIVYDKYSLSRFGDGEFKWMLGIKQNTFQIHSRDLANSLIRVIQDNSDNLLIGIPLGMVDSSKCNLYAKMYWEIIRYKCFPHILKYLDLNRTYSNASISRPYIDYNDREYSKQCFENLKRIWNNRDIVIVEGTQTKLGVGNDLFQNAKSIRRIICPAKNAFEKLDEIISTIEKNVSKEDIILAALGPTATVLASDICKKGFQIVDIGHIDVEYMWYLKKSIIRHPIEGKFVNESGVKECSNKYDLNSEYINSIIDKVES